MENPAKRMTVQGPQGEVTDTVEQLVGRLGMSDLGGSYFTFSNENNYMIWTFLKQCWQRGWLYRGADVMPWCSRCATGISQHEIVTDGYQELTHTSITLRLPLRGRERESLLVWTTTPWTLPSNVVAAVGPGTHLRQGPAGRRDAVSVQGHPARAARAVRSCGRDAGLGARRLDV